MALSAGDRLGPYEIISLIGEGGMGEVYRGRDTRLDRIVALKVSKAEFTERFEREARAVAALNHPNICALHDVGPNYLVMEYVEGATLGDRMARGVISLDEALPIARQMAEAIEAAHEKAIIHRDLKPGNIMITHDGVVKVLDFGLAAIGQSAVTVASDPANSPTVIAGATVAGAIMGTVGYMAPEQAAGKSVDKRADIWSFGVVVAEMLTGGRLFEGETVSHTFAHVLTRQVTLDNVPRPVHPLLTRCLDRDVRTRLRDIGEARIAIDRILAGGGAAGTSVTPPMKQSRRLWLPVAAGIAGAMLALTGGWLLYPRPEAELVEFEVNAPEGTRVIRPILSPDGRKLVFIGVSQTGTRLYLRSLDRSESQPIAGSESVNYTPFWSPDNRKVAFFADSKLKVADLSLGTVQALCNVSSGVLSGAWSSSKILLIELAAGNLLKVRESDGNVSPALMLDKDRKETAQQFPTFLPDGNRFLYQSLAEREPGMYLASLEGGKPQLNVSGERSWSRYVSGRLSKSSYLMYARGNQLFASPFDASRQFSTEAVFRIVEDALDANNWSVSDAGSLAYTSERYSLSRLTWMARDGRPIGTIAQPADYADVRLSPDGLRAAYSRSSHPNVWFMDLVRGSSSKLTSGTGREQAAVWSPDGTQIAYESPQAGISRLCRRPVNGAGNEEVLLESKDQLRAVSWSPNGKWLLYVSGGRGRWNIYMLPLSGIRKPTPLLIDPYDKFDAQFSPDGHWVAYSSTETGRREVYVRPTPETAGGMAGAQGKWPVSTGGGFHPRWKKDGKELYYMNLTGMLVAVPVEADAKSFRSHAPKSLFQINIATPGPLFPYDVSADGNKFLVLDRPGIASSFKVVLNWEARLQKP